MKRLLCLALALGACDKSADKASAGSVPGPTAASSASTSASAPPPPTIAVADASALSRERLTFVGPLGLHADTRIAVERRGTDVNLVIDATGGPRAFRGTMSGATHFAVTEIVKGHPPATFEGELGRGRLTGQSKEPGAKTPLAFSGVPITAFASESKFEESYVGALGGKIRIRVKLTRDGEKLSGIYRYARSKEDLHLVGTVKPDGHFALEESDGKGRVSGRFEGTFLRRGEALGDWSSADGKRSLSFSLEHGDAYPETIALEYGGRLAPQEDHREAPNCVAETIFPQAAGLKSKDAESALNKKLRALGGGAEPKGAMMCEGATAETPWSTESGYVVTAQRGRYVGITFGTGGYAGGAHGFSGSTCHVADLETGIVTELSPLLSADGRSKLTKLVTEKIKRAQKVTALTEAGYFEDEAKISPDTNLCFQKDGLEVFFNDYEIAPHVVGPTEVFLTKDEVRTFFAKSDLTDALFK